MAIDTELKTQVKKYLEKRGYKTTDDAKVLGKSGKLHTFDMLAKIDGGVAHHSVSICFIPDVDEKLENAIVGKCARSAEDADIEGKIIIAANPLSQRAQLLAQKQKIKVINKEQVKSLSDSAQGQSARPELPSVYENIPQLLETIANLSYKVEYKVKIKGKSGSECVFDIIAHEEDVITGHDLGIDIIHEGKEVNLKQVTSFDIKAYDASIDNKAVIVSTPLTHDAKQFVQKHKLKVLEVKHMSSLEAALDKKQPVAEEVKSTVKTEEVEAASEAAEGRIAKIQPQPEALQLIPEVMARRYNIVPLSISANTLKVAMVDPTDIFALEALAAKSKMRIKSVVADAETVREALDLNYKGYNEIERHISQVSSTGETNEDILAIDAALDAPLAHALTLILEEGVKTRASDIHIEPEENRLRVRYRIDGILHDMMSLPIAVNRALISRIKILSDMNIADHLRPQDGQFSFDAQGRGIDVRVATVPCVFGEMAVLRLLDKSRASRGLAEIGFLPESLRKFEAMLQAPYGMTLVSGPTGSGKTTTLYAAINSLDLVGRNVITIEDPAEYRFKDINQIQVNVQAGITFATGLRSILRLDPNIIMVGEIRDGETATIATQAALTGHLMLSSIHANDAATTFSRLIDLKVEPFLIASSVIGVIAQRMVRRVCPNCSHLVDAPKVEQVAYEKVMSEIKSKFLYGVGCEACAYSGYLGRTGIFEIISMSDDLRDIIIHGASGNEIRTQAIKEGTHSLIKDGMLKVQAGITTPAEVLRSAYAVE